jgi:hypothetical protein
VDPKRIIGKKWRAEEEERHKGSLTKKRKEKKVLLTINIDMFYSLFFRNCFILILAVGY